MISGALAMTMLLPTSAMAIGADSGNDPAPGNPRPVPSQPGQPVKPKPGGPGVTTGIVTRYSTAIINFDAISSGVVLGTVGIVAQQRCPGASGASVTSSYKYDLDNRREIKDSRVIASHKCLYPTITEHTERCTISSTAVVSIVAPRKSQLSTASDTSSWGAGDRTLDACRDSRTYAAVNASPSEFGRYEAVASTLVQNINVRSTKNAISGAVKVEIVGVGPAFRTNVANARGELSCNGWQDSWTGKNSWSMSDCGPDTSTPRYQCAPSGPATTINGETLTSATIMRDGDSNEVIWQQRVPTGNFAATGPGSTNVTREGTPWNTTSPNQNAAKNDAMLYSKDGHKSLFKSVNGTGVMLGNANAFDFRAVWASNAGAPTVLKPFWNIPGTTTVNSIVIEGFDSATGQFRTRAVQTTVATTASCSGDQVSFDVVRPITQGGF